MLKQTTKALLESFRYRRNITVQYNNSEMTQAYWHKTKQMHGMQNGNR
jgi:hypothetical protein